MAPFRLNRSTLDLALLALASGFGQFGAVASLAEVARDFGHAASADTFSGIVGLSGTTLGIGLAVLRFASLGALPLAALADRLGRRRVLHVVAVAGLLLTAVAAGSPSYWSFVALFALARPMLSATTTLTQVMCVELSSTKSRTYRLAWVAAGDAIGAGLAAILHGLLPGANGFRLLFALAAVPAVFVGRLLLRVPEPVARLSPFERASARLGEVPRALWRRLGVIAAVTIAIGVITGPANGFAFVYAESVLKISRHVIALVVVASSVTGLIGLVCGRWLADHAGRRGTVALGVLLSALTSLLAYSGGKSSFIAGYMTGVLAAALLAPALSAISNEVFPHAHRATAAGWVVVASVVGAIVGLVLFGYVGDVSRATLAVNSLRWPAIVTFLPLVPLVGLLWTVPETKDLTID